MPIHRTSHLVFTVVQRTGAHAGGAVNSTDFSSGPPAATSGHAILPSEPPPPPKTVEGNPLPTDRYGREVVADGASVFFRFDEESATGVLAHGQPVIDWSGRGFHGSWWSTGVAVAQGDPIIAGAGKSYDADTNTGGDPMPLGYHNLYSPGPIGMQWIQPTWHVTVECWVYRTAADNLDMVWSQLSVPMSDDNGAYLYLGGNFGVNPRTVVFGPQGNNASPTAQWVDVLPAGPNGNGTNIPVHLVLDYDGPNNTAELFVNGVSQGTRTGLGAGQAASASGYTRFGDWAAFNTYNQYPFRGRIDEYAVYAGSLPAERILLHYDVGTQGESVLYTRTAGDTADATDVADRATIYVRTADDTADATDAASGMASLVRRADDWVGEVVAAPYRSLAAPIVHAVFSERTYVSTFDAAVATVLYGRLAADDISGIADDVTRLLVLARTVDDTAPADDAATRLIVFARTSTDTAPADDAATRLATLLRSASDSAPASDAVTHQVLQFRTAADDISSTFGDATTRFVINARAPPDDISGLADVASRVATLLRAGEDAADASDAATRLFTGARGLDDTAPASDAVTHQALLIRTAADTAGATDAVTHQATQIRTAADSAGASDAVTHQTTLLRTGSDVISGLADDATRLATYARTADDTAPADDAATRQVVLPRTAADSASADDAATRSILLVRTADDTVAEPTDEATQSRLLPRTADDTAPADDAAIRLVTFARTVADSAPADDAAVRVATYLRDGADTAGATDDATRLIVVARSASDTAPADDAATRAVTFPRTADDSIAEPSDEADGIKLLIQAAADDDISGLTDEADGALVLPRTADDDISGTSDAVTHQATQQRTASDDVSGLTDDATRAQGVFIRTTSDSAPADDQGPLSPALLIRTAVDTAPADDAATRVILVNARALDDSAPASDAVTHQVTQFRTSSDTAGATDDATRALVLPRTGADTAPADDSAEGDALTFRTASDTAPADDAATRFIALVRSGDDSAPASDAITQQGTYARDLADSASADDAAVRLVTAARSAEDTASATDEVVHSGIYAREVGDDAPADDSAEGTLGRQENVDDAAPADDEATRQVNYVRSVTDDAPATDEAIQALTVVRTADDSAPASDSVERLRTDVRTSEDVAPATDAVTHGTTMFREATDGAPIDSDEAIAEGVLARTAEDTAPADDVVTRFATFVREVAEGEVVDPVLADGPVGFWPNEATDASGFGRHGTLVGNVDVGEPGPLGGTSIRLTGGTTYPRVRWDPPIDWLPTNAFTFEVWVNTTTTRSKALWSCGPNNEFLVLVSNGTTALYDGAVNNPIPHAPVADGEWHHFVVTRDAGQATIWVDGVPSDPLNFGPIVLQPDEYLVIGQEQDSNDDGYSIIQDWVGWVARPAIYDYALSSEQIQAHQQAGAPQGVEDDATRSLVLPRTGADTASADDSATHATSMARTVDDAAPASDAVAREVQVVRVTADSAPASDTVASGATLIRTADDSAPADDALTRALALSRTAVDTAPASDAVVHGQVIARLTDDAAPADDVAERVVALQRGASDFLGGEARLYTTSPSPSNVATDDYSLHAATTLDVRWFGEYDDYGVPGYLDVVTQHTGGQRAFRCQLRADTASLRFVASLDGLVLTTIYSKSMPTSPSGQQGLRWEVNAAGEARAYQADDPFDPEGTTWTQAGTTVTGVVLNMASGASSPVRITPVDAHTDRVEIRWNDGADHLDILDFATVAPEATTFESDEGFEWATAGSATIEGVSGTSDVADRQVITFRTAEDEAPAVDGVVSGLSLERTSTDDISGLFDTATSFSIFPRTANDTAPVTDDFARGYAIRPAHGRPKATIISLTSTRLSHKAEHDLVVVHFAFDQQVTAWEVRVGGTGPHDGTRVMGYVGPPVIEAIVPISAADLARGANEVHLYGRSTEGLWSH